MGKMNYIKTNFNIKNIVIIYKLKIYKYKTLKKN